jgi:hypothetical protein
MVYPQLFLQLHINSSELICKVAASQLSFSHVVTVYHIFLFPTTQEQASRETPD